MKITFFSNFLNHHQLELCNNFYGKLKDDFKFVATEEIPLDRKQLGYEDMNKKYPFVITTYDSKENKEKAIKLAIESDVIIHGSADEEYITKRMKTNKLTFRYSERICKKGKISLLYLPRTIKLLLRHTRYKNKNLRMLCAGGYVSTDFKLLAAYKDKMYKWGYFPKVKEYEIDRLLEKKEGNKVNILWCGRFLNWKHPEKAVKIAKKLINNGYNFELNMIGIGPKYKKIENYIIKNKLSKYVKLTGSMPPEDVRKYMEKANIFLFTSDYNEGWGAVLNEALNSGCAVVASNAIGAVPFLIKDNVNGLIYKNNNYKDLYIKVEKLLKNKNKRENLGRNAYIQMNKVWNATNAVDNFLILVNKLLYDNEDKEIIGPCSDTKIIKQSKMYDKLIKGEQI